MHTIKGVIFDLDGVLIDSEELTSDAAIIYFKEKGFKVKKEDFIPFFGTGEKGYFGGVAQKYGIPYENEVEADRIYMRYAELSKGKVGPLPGVADFIAICKTKNLKLAVATSASLFKLRINLQLIGFADNTFDTLVCGTDIKKNKPDPEIFITAAHLLGLEPEDCLVIEDSPSGVEAAKGAGSRCLAVLTSFSISDLKKADWIIHDLTEYPDEVFNFASR